MKSECAIQFIIYDPRLKTKPVSLDSMCGITNDALKVVISQMLRISSSQTTSVFLLSERHKKANKV